MLNRMNLLLWVSIQKKHTFYIPVPIPLYVVAEIFEGLVDLMTLVSPFFSRKDNSVNQYVPKLHTFSISQLNDIIGLLEELLESLTTSEPFDLVTVSTPDISINVKVR